MPRRSIPCPLCDLKLTTELEGWGDQRRSLGMHVRRIHVELSVRERSVVVDEMMRELTTA
jgi:hypothetical protein